MRGAGAEAERINQFGQRRNAAGNVKGAVFDRCHQQITGRDKGGTTYFFLAGTKGDFVEPTHGNTARFAKSGAHASQILQFQRNVFKNMAGPSAFAQAQ